jgi:hypothetical protein
MLHLDRNGDEPPVCTVENGRTQGFAGKTHVLTHIDLAQLRNMQGMPVNREFVVSQVEAQSITLFALEMREARFLSILAWVFEPGLRPLFFHAPKVGEGVPQIGKCLFRSTLRGFVHPGKLLTFDLVVLRLEVVHLDPLALCPRLFPTGQCPVIGMTSNTARLAKVHLLFWCAIQSDHVGSIHVIPLAFPGFSEGDPVLAVPRLVSIVQRFCPSCQRYTADKV